MTNPTPRMPDDEPWEYTELLDAYNKLLASLPAPETVESLLDSIEGPHQLTRDTNGKYRFKIWGDYAEKRLSVTGYGDTPADSIKSALGKLTGGES